MLEELRGTDTLATSTADLAARNGLRLKDISAFFAHAGNGRFPRLLARHLAIPAERIRSLTEHAGNLGSASLPAAWASEDAARVSGPMLWTAAAAGLTWGAALTQTGSV